MPYEYQKNAAGEYVCHHCGATKKNQNTMHYHLKRHEGKLPFQCSICNKEFLYASVLSLHMSARHADKIAAADTYKCPCCDHSALTKSNRAVHYVRTHCVNDLERFVAKSSEPLHCPTCSKSCKSSASFLYHIASQGCLTLSSSEQMQQLRSLFS